MQEFIVEITTAVPDGTSGDEVDRRREAEAVRTRELAADGRLVRLWRSAGSSRTIGLWRASDEADLEQEVLDTLPLRPWMTVRITPLVAHPNDPDRAGAAE